MSGDELIELCLVSQLDADTPFEAEIDGEAVGVFEVDGAYYAIQNLCTHGPGLLSEGFVDGDEVECPFHQGKFCISTGLPTAAPCTIPLKTWPVVVTDGRIFARRR